MGHRRTLLRVGAGLLSAFALLVVLVDQIRSRDRPVHRADLGHALMYVGCWPACRDLGGACVARCRRVASEVRRRLSDEAFVAYIRSREGAASDPVGREAIRICLERFPGGGSPGG